MSKRFGLQKKEKLKSRKSIEDLFEKKQRFSVAPVQVWYCFHENKNEDAPVKVGFSCSKKQFKKAVHRNRVKRLLRESYRLQKHQFSSLAETRKRSADVFFIYSAPVLPVYSDIFETMGKCLRQLEKKLLHESVG